MDLKQRLDELGTRLGRGTSAFGRRPEAAAAKEDYWQRVQDLFTRDVTGRARPAGAVRGRHPRNVALLHARDRARGSRLPTLVPALAHRSLSRLRGHGLPPFARAPRLLRPGYKLLFDSERGSAEFYDRATDPGETQNLVTRDPLRVAAYRLRLFRWILAVTSGEAGEAQAAVLGPEQQENLRALGYVD